MSPRAIPSKAFPPHLAAIAAAVLVCLCGFAVYHGALPYFFAQDDFIGLARARDLAHRVDGPWRWLSGQAYFDVMKGLAGLAPLPYRIVSLVTHLATACLLMVWLRRRTSPAAAWAGATFFVVHPALFTALYSIWSISETLALGFALAALLLVTRRDAARWLALPAFALSLMSKESTLLLPLLAAIELGGDRRRPASFLRPVTVALALIAVAYAAYFVMLVSRTQFGGAEDPALAAAAPYAMRFDATIMWNLLTYAGWTVNFLLPTVVGFADVVTRAVTPAAAVAVAGWLAGLAWVPLRRAGWGYGGVVFVAFLAPMLPLANHTYHYYLYAALAGAALCVAALVDAVGARAATARRGTAPAVWIAAALAALLTVNGALLVGKIEHHPFTHPDLRADPTVDRARIAGHVHEGLEAARPPAGARLRFWSPIAVELERAAGRDTTVESYWERNVRMALLNGVAVRMLFPQVASVEFVHAFAPGDDSTFYAVYAVDGRLRLVPAAELEAVLRGMAGPEGS